MLSNTCKYAIRAVSYLAAVGDGETKIGIKQIAKDLEIPSPFLGKILQVLAKQKLLNSTKGPHGGFSLARPGDQITLLDIVDIIDGRDVFDQCLIGLKICGNDPEKRKKCTFHPKSDPVRTQLYEVFNSQTVADLAKGFNSEDVVKYI